MGAGVTGVTAARRWFCHLSLKDGGAGAGVREESQMTRFAQAAWTQAQAFTVFALCITAGLALPLSLALIGFPTA